MDSDFSDDDAQTMHDEKTDDSEADDDGSKTDLTTSCSQYSFDLS